MLRIVSFSKLYRFIAIGILAIISLFIINGLRVGAEDIPTATVSGTITANDGTPLSNVFVYLNYSNPTLYACTDANGHYSIEAPSNTGYRVEFSGSLSYGNPNCGTYSAPIGSDAPADFIVRSQSESTVADLTSGNVVKNFSLPTSKLTIVAKDADGNLVTAPFRQAYTYRTQFYESAVISGGDGGLLYGTTQLPATQLNSSGQVTGYVVKGTVFPAGTICVNPLTSSEYCNQSSVTVNGDTTVTVQPIITPPAPNNLSAQSPTKIPNLAWGVTPNATLYNVYRNNVKIDSTSTNSYSDMTAPEGDNTYYVTAVNTGESSSSNSVYVTVDRTLPGVTYALSPTPNSNGWNNSDTTVTYTCTDDRSGIDTCSDAVTVSVEGANQSVTGTAVDKAGNTISTIAHVSIDKTAPTITASVSAAPNAGGWNNGAVTVTFNCNDTLSTIDTCTSPVTVTNEGLNQVVTGTAVDKAGNITTTTAVVSIDKTKPTIVATQNPTTNAAGWNNTNVTVMYTCSDSLSGIATCSSPTTISAEGNNLSATGTAADKAGNTNSVTLTPIKIDKTAPTATGATVSNAIILLTRPTQAYTATVGDALSGVVSGEFYIGTIDPGVGHGTAMTYSSSTGKITGTMSTSGLNAGTYTVNMRSKDAAGNWSAVTTKTFTIIL
jgi:hypothetical protein